MTGPSRQPDDVDVFTGMKPLHGLRSWIFAEGWALTAVGLAGLPYVIAVPNPHKDGVISILVEYVLGVAILILACGRWTFPRVDTAVAVRSDVPVKPPKGQLTTAALTVALLLMLMLPSVVLTDSSLAPFLPGVILGSGLGHLVWGTGWPGGRTSTASSSWDPGGDSRPRGSTCAPALRTADGSHPAARRARHPRHRSRQPELALVHPESVIDVVIFVPIWAVVMGLVFSRSLDRVALVPPDVPVEESRSAFWIWGGRPRPG